MQHKTFAVTVEQKDSSGGRIRISSQQVDRDRDRVVSGGVVLANYLQNPIVLWGHGYYEPWQTIGRTENIEVLDGELVADFELRPAANEQDPQNVVRLLWEGGWINAASIGFNPLRWQENDLGGRDITEWELLEWSLVPIPANQNALRLAAKAMGLIPSVKSVEPEVDGEEPGPTVDEAEAETTLAAILAEFISAVRPYLAGGEDQA
jgi:HK97 family phage prohead protease